MPSAGASQNPPDLPPVQFRWLGVAGIELSYQGESLLIDPFFTRPPFLSLWFGRVAPNPAHLPASLPRCEHILVTHAHYDHLLDVPLIAHRTLARVYGSTNTCALLRTCGVPEAQIGEIHTGEQLWLGSFQVDVLLAKHGWAPGYASGKVREGLTPPLRLRDYVLGEYSSFLVQAPGKRLLDWCGVETQGAPRADVLFMLPSSRPGYVEGLLAAVQPKLVVPVHWDDIFRPLSQPLRPSFELPRWGWPPLRRIRLERFVQVVGKVAPTAKVLVPEPLKSYELNQAL